MTIFFVGIALFVVGAALVIWARARERREVAGNEDAFFAWFLEVLKESFSVLTSAEATSWQRVAAGGSILSGLGVLTAIVGLISWAVA